MKREDTLGYQFRLIHNQLHRIMEAKRSEHADDLTAMQSWIVGYLKDHEDKVVCQRDIEVAFSISRATASNMLSVMERKGLIVRSAVEHDARLKQLLLTEHARNMQMQVEQDASEMEERIRAGMTAEEVAVFQRLMRLVMDNLDVEQQNLVNYH